MMAEPISAETTNAGIKVWNRVQNKMQHGMKLQWDKSGPYPIRRIRYPYKFISLPQPNTTINMLVVAKTKISIII